MTDDPRDILKAAGVECAEVERYKRGILVDAHPLRHKRLADDAILALYRLMAKYKWQRDAGLREYAEVVDEEWGINHTPLPDNAQYHEIVALSDSEWLTDEQALEQWVQRKLVDLNRRWGEHQS